MSGAAVVQARAVQARAVLDRAEARTRTTRWVRPPPTTPGPVVEVVVPADGPERARTVAAGRALAVDPEAAARVLPVSPALTGLLPSGGLDRGSTVVVGGSMALVLALLAEASRSGSWVGVVALPRIGVLAAHQLGLDLDRVVLVPAPGPDGATVVAALLDGLDVVVVGEAALVDGDRRRLSARARERGAVLVSTAPWPGARVVLTVEASHWEGLGRGHGRLRERRLTVLGTGRGSAARGWRTEVTLPVGPGTGPVTDPLAVRPLRLWDGRRAG